MIETEKRRTIELTWAETATTQAKGKKTPFITKSLFPPHVQRFVMRVLEDK